MTVPGIGGAPLKYTPGELERKIVEYFEWVESVNVERKEKGERLKPFTITGICVYLGICKDTWIDYGKRAEYVDSIKKAKTTVENYVEEGVLNGEISTIGGIFNLKNNFGWVDKHEVSVNDNDSKLTTDDVSNLLNKK